jgi:hypothetical protein
LTQTPSARSIAVIRREPKNGQAMNSASIRRISARSAAASASRGR